MWNTKNLKRKKNENTVFLNKELTRLTTDLSISKTESRKELNIISDPGKNKGEQKNPSM